MDFFYKFEEKSKNEDIFKQNKVKKLLENMFQASLLI